MRGTGRTPGLGALALAFALALALSGCGGEHASDRVATAGSPGHSAPSPSAANMNEQEQALRYAQCMRDNGIPNFPDPKFEAGGGTSITLPDGADKAKVDAAQAKCQRYLPGGGDTQKADPKVVEQLRKFSQCMRDQGIANFPDPTDGGLQVDNNKLAIDPNSAKFQAAQQACAKYQPTPPSGGAGAGTSVWSNG